MNMWPSNLRVWVAVSVMPLFILHHEFESWHAGSHIQDFPWVVQKHFFLPMFAFHMWEGKPVPCHCRWVASHYLIQSTDYNFSYTMLGLAEVSPPAARASIVWWYAGRRMYQSCSHECLHQIAYLWDHGFTLHGPELTDMEALAMCWSEHV